MHFPQVGLVHGVTAQSGEMPFHKRTMKEILYLEFRVAFPFWCLYHLARPHFGHWRFKNEHDRDVETDGSSSREDQGA